MKPLRVTGMTITRVTFQLKQSQPSLFLTGVGVSRLSRHVSTRDMPPSDRTGPLQITLEFKQNASIRGTRNLDYWKKDRPYLTVSPYFIMKNVSTGVLAFVAGSAISPPPTCCGSGGERRKGQAPGDVAK